MKKLLMLMVVLLMVSGCGVLEIIPTVTSYETMTGCFGDVELTSLEGSKTTHKNVRIGYGANSGFLIIESDEGKFAYRGDFKFTPKPSPNSDKGQVCF